MTFSEEVAIPNLAVKKNFIKLFKIYHELNVYGFFFQLLKIRLWYFRVFLLEKRYLSENKINDVN